MQVQAPPWQKAGLMEKERKGHTMGEPENPRAKEISQEENETSLAKGRGEEGASEQGL